VIRLGEATPRGYDRADFHDAWHRYLPQPPQHPQQDTETAGQDRCGPQTDRRNPSATPEPVADALRHQTGIRNAPTSDVAPVAPVADPPRAGGNGARHEPPRSPHPTTRAATHPPGRGGSPPPARPAQGERATPPPPTGHPAGRGCHVLELSGPIPHPASDHPRSLPSGRQRPTGPPRPRPTATPPPSHRDQTHERRRLPAARLAWRYRFNPDAAPRCGPTSSGAHRTTATTTKGRS
jgi:hypothetical protein